MALVVEFLQVSAERSSKHKPVTCGWRVVQVGRERLLQLDTYGSMDRVIPEKVSQSIQLDYKAAVELRQLIDVVFPGVGGTSLDSLGKIEQEGATA